MGLKQLVSRLPLVRGLYRAYSLRTFAGSRDYWEKRYARGGDSGAGSYGQLAEFKAEVLNRFVDEHEVRSVIEFGCGDGNQLTLAQYPAYIGLDVSPAAIARCIARFEQDRTKSFFVYEPELFVDHRGVFSTDLAMSLDVIYHLPEDSVYERYMSQLFGAAERFVIIYSSNRDEGRTAAHVRHRRFTDWVARRAPQWRQADKIGNPYPGDPAWASEASVADFYIFEKARA